jgi:Short C-terminal domain
MAQTKMPSQVSCPHCNAGNMQGSPHCSSCGSPLDIVVVPRAHTATSPRASAPRAVVDPIALLSSDGQDRGIVKQMYERASVILTAGETIEYVAVARGSLGHTPDSAVATNKRLLLYRKKVLGKVELDDCYWRDMGGITLTDVKGGINLMLNAIQGWRLLVENLPKAQATKLHEVATGFSERLRNSAQSQDAQQEQSSPSAPSNEPSVVFTPAQTESAVATPAMPSTPLILPSLTPQFTAHLTSPAMRLGEQTPAPAVPRNPGTGLTPTPNPAYSIPTPESVLQNILQSSAFDGDLEAGVPTRPMQWSAAAFQAPALAEAQPIVLREHDPDNGSVVSANAGDDTGSNLSNSNSSGLHLGPESWNLHANGSGNLGAGGNGHDTESQLRVAPPLTTLERIAVFSLPSGSLGHDISTRLSAPFDSEPLPVVDTGFHLVPRFPQATTQATGNFPNQEDQADNNNAIEPQDSSEDPLRVLAKKISGSLDDTLPFSSAQLHTLNWSLDNTGVISDDAMDAQNTELISLMLGPDEMSGPLYPALSENSTAPDPQLVEALETSGPQEGPEALVAVEALEPATVLEAVEPQDAPEADAETATPVASVLNDEFISIVGYADESLSVSRMPAPSLSAPVSPISPISASLDDVDENEPLFSMDSSNSHPTEPMGSVDDFLPVPGSMTSGPLLAASANMDREMEDGYTNASPMATQRLDYEHQMDPGDRPTSINLTMSSIPTPSNERERRVSGWRNSETPSGQAPRTSGDDPKKPRGSGSSTFSRASSSKSAAEDPIAKMKQLKAMLDAGFITDEDYATKKAEILSRI